MLGLVASCPQRATPPEARHFAAYDCQVLRALCSRRLALPVGDVRGAARGSDRHHGRTVHLEWDGRDGGGARSSRAVLLSISLRGEGVLADSYHAGERAHSRC